MGKSVDLPDPLESAAPQPLGNADDLLAQLAGEEVDRLLADADAEGKRQPKPGEARRAADTAADLSAAVTGPPPDAAAMQHQLDALFSTMPGGEPNAEAESEPEPEWVPPPKARSGRREPVAPIAPEPLTALKSKLPDDINADEVLAAILGDPPSTPPAALPAPETDDAPAPAAGAFLAPLTPASVKRTDLATSTAERQALSHLDPADALPGPGELEALSGPIHADDDAPLPAYLKPIVKPLEWMNAPLDLLPSTLRDVLGQIAILTLVNAIAVLIYVFVFRNK